MFSRTAEYALRAVCVLARQEHMYRTTQDIARVSQVPADYLRKVLQLLRRAGIVGTQRGVGGGIRLCRGVDEVTVLDVVNAVDPIQRIERCPLGLAEHGVTLCPLHSQLDEVLARMEDTLRGTTIADLMDPRQRTGVRCPFPNLGKKERTKPRDSR